MVAGNFNWWVATQWKFTAKQHDHLSSFDRCNANKQARVGAITTENTPFVSFRGLRISKQLQRDLCIRATYTPGLVGQQIE